MKKENGTDEPLAQCRHSEFIEDYEQGEMICKRCGLVMRQQLLNRGPEWRAFTAEEGQKKRRVGMPTSYAIYDKGLSTAITQVDRDAYGRKIPAARRMKMLSLQRWQNRMRLGSSMDRNLSQAMAELDRLADQLHIPSSIKEIGALIYRKSLNEGLVRGRSIAAIVAASLYAACRQSNVPRTLKDIASASRIRKKDIARCYRLLLRALTIRMPIADPIRSIPKIAASANIPPNIQSRAIEIVNEAKLGKVHVGKDPMGFAAAALYLACLDGGHNATQRSLAEAANVTEVTVRNRYKGLKEKLRLAPAA
ncbi:MAG: transcription initiation factor IIB [archaeon]